MHVYKSQQIVLLVAIVLYQLLTKCIFHYVLRLGFVYLNAISDMT